MQKVIDRIKLIFKEIGNLLTNIIVPLVPILMIILETVGVSDNVLAKVKQWEYVLFQISGTLEDLEHKD